MADSAEISRVLRLLTSTPQRRDKLLHLVLALALGEEDIRAETATVYLCDPLDRVEANVVTARFAARVFMTTEGTPTERSQPPSLDRFSENDGSVAGWVLANGEHHESPDCQSCELYKQSPSEPQFKSLMCLPIIYGRTPSGRPRLLGLINLHNKQSVRPWSDEHVHMIEPWADITALAILANHHELTMLPNRPFTEYLVTEAIGRSRPLYVAYIDLDDFGAVNEAFGHRPANEVIQQFAASLRQDASEGVTLCHMHGDEFVLLIEDRTRDEALAKVNAVLMHVGESQDKFQSGGQTVSERLGNPLTATAGLAEWTAGMQAYELIDAADKANAKQKGDLKGRVRATWAE